MNKEYRLLLSLIRRVIVDRDQEKLKSITDEELLLLPGVIKLAGDHDVLPIIAEALSDCELPERYSAKLNKSKLLAVFRSTSIMAEQTAVAEVLEENKIPFILLKGAVVRNKYPELWMRTSSDIDILLHSEDIDKAIELLKSELEYKFSGRTPHDVSVFAPSGVHVELHFMLIERLRMPESVEVLQKVWRYAHPVSEGSAEHKLEDTMYFYYHIAHMAKHFLNGGCGVRSFIDLWLLNKYPDGKMGDRCYLLAAGKLIYFADKATHLSRVWFEDAEYNDTCLEMEKYILSGGVYGNIKNMVATNTSKKSSKFKYVLSRLFLPYEDLRNRYPKMGRYKILIPVMQLRRWLALLNPKRRKRASNELREIDKVSRKEVEQAKKLLSELHL